MPTNAVGGGGAPDASAIGQQGSQDANQKLQTQSANDKASEAATEASNMMARWHQVNETIGSNFK